jgi:hypothetical protein
MSFRRIHTDEKPLTVGLAKQIYEMPPLRGEREFKESRAKYLLDRIRSGEFADPIWATCFVSGDPDRVFRANGQHSSYQLSHLPPDVPFPKRPDGTPQTALIEVYELDSVNDAPKLFDKFDNPKSVRSNVDYMQQSRVAYPELAYIKTSLLSRLCNGIELWESTSGREASRGKGVKGSNVKPSLRGVSTRYRGDLHLAIPENRQYLLWLAPFSAELHGKFLGRPPITAEIYGAWRTNQQLAEEFWSYVLKESHPEPDDETRELARELSTAMQRRSVSNMLRTRSRTVWRRYLRAHTQAQLVPSTTTTTQQEEQPSV